MELIATCGGGDSDGSGGSGGSSGSGGSGGSGVESESGGGDGMTNCDDIGCCRKVRGDAQLTPSGTISISFSVRTYEKDPRAPLRAPAGASASESTAMDALTTSLGPPESVANSTDACSLAAAAATAAIDSRVVLALPLVSVGLIGLASDKPTLGILTCSRIA